MLPKYYVLRFSEDFGQEFMKVRKEFGSLFALGLSRESQQALASQLARILAMVRRAWTGPFGSKAQTPRIMGDLA